MKWEEYVQKFENKEDPEFGSLNFIFPGVEHHEPSFFIRLNNELLTDFGLLENKRLIFSYLASNQFVLSLTVFNVIKNVLSGYNSTISKVSISSLKPGDKFLLGKAVCVLDSLREDDVYGLRAFIGVHSGGCFKSRGMPVNNFKPVVKANPQSKESTFRLFVQEYDKFFHGSDEEESVLSVSTKLKSLKDKQASSVILVSQIKVSEKMLCNSTIESVPILDVISIAKTNYFGQMEWFNKKDGSLNPELVIAPDIKSARDLICSDDGPKVSTLFVDLNFCRDILPYIQSVEDLLAEQINIVFFLPENESFDLSSLLDHDFKVFRWTSSMILPAMVEKNLSIGSHLLKRASNRSIEPVFAKDGCAMSAYLLLSKHRDSIEVEDDRICGCYYALISLAYRLIRMISPIPEANKAALISDIENRYLSVFSSDEVVRFLKNSSIKQDFLNAWAFLKSALADTESPKEIAVIDQILGVHKRSREKVALIVDESVDSKKAEGHYADHLFRSCLDEKSVKVFTPEEFLEASSDFDSVIVCGWLKKETMRSIIFSNLGSVFFPVLYSCESLWMNSAIKEWNLETVQSDIHTIDPEIDPIPPTHLNLNIKGYEITKFTSPKDEDIDDILKRDDDTKFRGFRTNSPKDEPIEATPVNFNDGSYGVFTEYNRFICLTSMINGESDEIATKTISDLQIGDIVLFRNSPNDIIRNMADSILEQGGNSDARANATLWKSLFLMEISQGKTTQDIIIELKNGGIRKSACEIRNWINDDDLICPRSKEDLSILAKVLNDPDQGSWIDEAQRSASIVRAAHQQAGKRITQLLLKNPDFDEKIRRLSSSPDSLEKSDSINIEKIGQVYLLRIIDIGQKSDYSKSQVNKRRL